MSNGNHGSKKPLNWKEPTFAKSDSNGDVDPLDVDGVPKTVRKGSYNGLPSSLRRNNRNPSINPSLYVEKAFGLPEVPLRPNQPQPPIPGQPPQQGIAGGPPAAQGPSPQPGAQAGGMPGQSGMPKPPGANSAIPTQSNTQPNSDDEQIGNTEDNKPVFEDPFNPQHQGFDMQDHNQAAQQNQGMADAAQDPMDQQKFGQNASIHDDMAMDAASPSERGQSMFGQVPDGAMSNSPGNMDPATADLFMRFLGMIASGNPDQNKPIMADANQMGPKPGMMERAAPGLHMQGSSSRQDSMGAPKAINPGPTAPPTNAGSQHTEVQPSQSPHQPNSSFAPNPMDYSAEDIDKDPEGMQDFGNEGNHPEPDGDEGSDGKHHVSLPPGHKEPDGDEGSDATWSDDDGDETPSGDDSDEDDSMNRFMRKV